ncbi:hypothetical protein [Lysobacter gummosus]|uniref:hypothetical protein n=1 Tax=Lysobacter gummosus TaxID=262324 RepID=UPI00364555BF
MGGVQGRGFSARSLPTKNGPDSHPGRSYFHCRGSKPQRNQRTPVPSVGIIGIASAGTLGLLSSCR